MKRIIIAAMAAVLILTACNRITQGEVYDKQFIPAHSETYTSSRSTYINGEWVNLPYVETKYYPDEYRVFIRKETEKGQFDTAVYTVGEEKYNLIHIGDEISFE